MSSQFGGSRTYIYSIIVGNAPDYSIKKINCQQKVPFDFIFVDGVKPILLRTYENGISWKILLFEAQVRFWSQFSFKSVSDLNSELLKLLLSMNTCVEISEMIVIKNINIFKSTWTVFKGKIFVTQGSCWCTSCCKSFGHKLVQRMILMLTRLLKIN